MLDALGNGFGLDELALALTPERAARLRPRPVSTVPHCHHKTGQHLLESIVQVLAPDCFDPQLPLFEASTRPDTAKLPDIYRKL